MVKKAVLVLSLFVACSAFAQKDWRYAPIEVMAVPKRLTQADEIAHYLTQDLSTDVEKARAIYLWIAYNISYDLYSNTASQTTLSNEELVDVVLMKKKGVCMHYATLFHAMGSSVGLNSFIVQGYTRNVFGSIDNIGHAWNAIKLEDEYFLIDATWAAGFIRNGNYYHEFRDEYFLVSPQTSILDHMPYDPIWQFLSNPISHQSFIAGDFSDLDRLGTFAYKDSLKHHLEQDKLMQLEDENRRIKRMGIKHKLIREHYQLNLTQMAWLRYNEAIDTLNYGINQFNKYVAYKNQFFENPPLTDIEIQNLIGNASLGIKAADQMLSDLTVADKQLQSVVFDTAQQLPAILQDVKREESFVERYLATTNSKRKRLFY